MSFRKAGTQEAYTPGSTSSSSPPPASATPTPAAASASTIGGGAARPAKKSRFARAGGGVPTQKGAGASVEAVQGRYGSCMHYAQHCARHCTCLHGPEMFAACFRRLGWGDGEGGVDFINPLPHDTVT